MLKPSGTYSQDGITTYNRIKAQIFVYTGRKACSQKYILFMMLLLLLTSQGKITQDVTNLSSALHLYATVKQDSNFNFI